MAALGSKLAQLQGKVCEATRFAAKHGCAYQKSLLEKNKQYVVQPATVEKCQELSKQLFCTRIARCDSPLPIYPSRSPYMTASSRSHADCSMPLALHDLDSVSCLMLFVKPIVRDVISEIAVRDVYMSNIHVPGQTIVCVL
jgi:hypothetical protein